MYFIYYFRIKYLLILFVKVMNSQNIIVLHFPKSVYKPSSPCSMIYSDLWGFSRTPNLTHTRWFVMFIDGQIQICWVYMSKEMVEACFVFINFHAMIRTQFQTKIQILNTDQHKIFQ